MLKIVLAALFSVTFCAIVQADELQAREQAAPIVLEPSSEVKLIVISPEVLEALIKGQAGNTSQKNLSSQPENFKLYDIQAAMGQSRSAASYPGYFESGFLNLVTENKRLNDLLALQDAKIKLLETRLAELEVKANE